MFAWRRMLPTVCRRSVIHGRTSNHIWEASKHWNGAVAFGRQSVLGKRFVSESVQVEKNLKPIKTRAPPTRRPAILTLDPRKFGSVGQQVLDFSGFVSVVQQVFLHGVSSRADLFYYTKKQSEKLINTRFPPNTRGYLYFSHSASNDDSHLRFRLCEDAAGFQDGSDLLLPTGQPWGPSLKQMASGRKTWGSLLALATDDFAISPAQAGEQHTMYRQLSTLSPEKLRSTNQQIYDISGQGAARLQGVPETPSSYIPYHASSNGNLPFPPGSCGFFYYKQSVSSPTVIGELRFRICSGAETFHEGTDLQDPYGAPWCTASSTIRGASRLESIYHFLVEEGLLLPNQPHHPSHTEAESKIYTRRYLTTFSELFVMDLSKKYLCLAVKLDSGLVPIDISYLFHRKLRLYRPGRVVARLEEYPDPSTHPHCRTDKPLFTLRVLEWLTPIECAPDAPDTTTLPQPGDLLVHQSGRYKGLVWGYNPSGNKLAKLRLFIKQSTSTI